MEKMPYDSLSNDRWTHLATLLRPQGRRGEMLSEPQTDLEEPFVPGRAVWLSNNGKSPIDAAASRVLEESWRPTGRNAGRVVLKLSGCNSISEAEALEGQHLLIPASELPALDDDTYFVNDLLGCALYDGEQLVGSVSDLQFATSPDGKTRLEEAPPLLVILPPHAKDEDDEILIPFVRAWLESVDTGAKRIVMHLPEGFFDDLDTEEPDDDSY